jgi:hypothetical protein
MARQSQPLPFLKSVAVNSGKIERMVDPRTLTAGQKKILWAGIKKENPQLAEMMQTDPLKDPITAMLQHEFNAHIELSVSDFNRYLAAGLNNKKSNHD